MRMKSVFWIALLLAGSVPGTLPWMEFGAHGLLAAQTHPEDAPAQTGSHAAHSHEADHEKERIVRLEEAQVKQFAVEVVAATAGQLQSEITLPGEVVLNEDRKAHIVPRVPGVVKEVRKNLGDSVREGEIMAVLESRELADAKAEYLASREKESIAQAKFRREEGLWKKRISSEQEYLDARQQVAESRIALRSARQKLHALGFSQEHLRQLSGYADDPFTRFEITAPFAATVIEKHIVLGEKLKEDTEVFTVADLDTVWVNLNIYQKDLPKVKKEQRVSIHLGQDGEEPTEGRIAYIDPLVKEQTRTALARVILPNPHGNWRPGMFVTARIMTKDAPAPILVPQSAIQTVDEKPVVFVQVEEGFEARPVTLGRTSNGTVEIVSGLSAGERYAAKGAFTLKAQLSKETFGDGHNH